MPTPPRTYHGEEPPGDPEDGMSGPSEPVAWASLASSMVGTVIDGRYRIDALLGAGAMAFVLDGHHVHLGKRVALKVLHPELAELGELRARFQREARAASRVAHPAVIEVTDFGVSEDGLYYLVMEHLSGQDLHRWMSERGRLAVDVVAGIGQQLAGALDAIHQAGFVHRDVKPENIFVLDGDEAVPAIKVLDLGIAAVSAQRPSKDDPRLTRAGQTLGTVSFMAPEQVAARPLDGRVDIYAAGCVLFELLTGRLPFEAETATEIMMAHLREPPPDVRTLRADVPDWFAEVISRCLAKRPEDRFARASELALALEGGRAAPPLEPVKPADPREASQVSPVRSERPSGPSVAVAPKERTKRTRWPAIGIAVGVAALVAGVVVFVSPGAEPTDPTSDGAEPVLVPASAGWVGGPSGTSVGTGLEMLPPDAAPTAVDTSTPLEVGAETDTVGPGDMVVEAEAPPDTIDTIRDTMPDTGSGTSSDSGPTSKVEDGVRVDPPENTTTRPRTTPRTPPRTGTTPTAPAAPTTPDADSKKTPSGLWRPRPPGGGD